MAETGGTGWRGGVHGRRRAGIRGSGDHSVLGRTLVARVLPVFAILLFVIGADGAGKPVLGAPKTRTGKPSGADTRTGARPIPSDLLDAEREAVEWIKGQMVPNQTVPSPHPGRRRLILSYRVPRTDQSYPYVHSRSFVYDDALGAVALTMAGELDHAESILGALARLLADDGGLWFAYNTHNNWPDRDDHDGALIRTGSVAWVGYALTFHIGARARLEGEHQEGDAVGNDPVARDLLREAEKIARFMLERQVRDEQDARFGLFTGGSGSYTLACDPVGSKPEESYDGAPLRWVSMEHNIDAFFFLRDLARLTGERVYGDAADAAMRGLMRLWSERDDQFYQGIHGDGTVDGVLPLDGATWGTLFLLAAGREDLARRCLSAMDERFSSAGGGVKGYRPYADKAVYEDESVNRFFFPENPGMRWRNLDFVWGEGSFGAAAAMIRSGDSEGGERVLASMLALREEGGFRYGSMNLPFQFNDYPSVASTAWFVIAVEMLRGKAAAGGTSGGTALGDLFWAK